MDDLGEGFTGEDSTNHSASYGHDGLGGPVVWLSPFAAE